MKKAWYAILAAALICLLAALCLAGANIAKGSLEETTTADPFPGLVKPGTTETGTETDSDRENVTDSPFVEDAPDVVEPEARETGVWGYRTMGSTTYFYLNCTEYFRQVMEEQGYDPDTVDWRTVMPQNGQIGVATDVVKDYGIYGSEVLYSADTVLWKSCSGYKMHPTSSTSVEDFRLYYQTDLLFDENGQLTNHYLTYFIVEGCDSPLTVLSKLVRDSDVILLSYFPIDLWDWSVET